MNDNLTDITVLLDRTGSMSTIKDDVIGGFNEFVRKQQQMPGQCVLSLIQFDSVNPFEVMHDTSSVAQVPALTDRTYEPRAATPLFDALGNTIVKTSQRFAAIAETDRPGHVVFVVITDGHENASVQYTRKQIFTMIKRQQEVYNWQFVFLAAGQDAITEAEHLGMDSRSSLRWGKTGTGVLSAFTVSSAKLARFRTSHRHDDLHFTLEERNDQDSEIKKGDEVVNLVHP